MKAYLYIFLAVVITYITYRFYVYQKALKEFKDKIRKDFAYFNRIYTNYGDDYEGANEAMSWGYDWYRMMIEKATDKGISVKEQFDKDETWMLNNGDKPKFSLV